MLTTYLYIYTYMYNAPNIIYYNGLHAMPMDMSGHSRHNGGSSSLAVYRGCITNITYTVYLIYRYNIGLYIYIYIYIYIYMCVCI